MWRRGLAFLPGLAIRGGVASGCGAGGLHLGEASCDLEHFQANRVRLRLEMLSDSPNAEKLFRTASGINETRKLFSAVPAVESR